MAGRSGSDGAAGVGGVAAFEDEDVREQARPAAGQPFVRGEDLADLRVDQELRGGSVGGDGERQAGAADGVGVLARSVMPGMSARTRRLVARWAWLRYWLLTSATTPLMSSRG